MPWRPSKTDDLTAATPAAPETSSEADKSTESDGEVDPAPSTATAEIITSDASAAPASSDPSPPPEDSTAAAESDTDAEPSASPLPPRMLHWRNFGVALKEITPSSSEMLGTLSDLRKWNEEFGEGRKEKRHKSVWGKGKFGFIPKPVDGHDEAKVADPSASDKKSESGAERRP